MKNIYKLLALSLLLIATASCGDEWLNTVPSDSVPTGDAITSYKAASVALSGVYDGLQGSSSRETYYAARMFYYGDVRGDDMQAQKAGNRSSSTYEMRYFEDNAPNMWNVPYNVIRRANSLIDAVEQGKILDANDAQLTKLKAEALVVRALVHFDLVRIHGNPYTMDNGASLGVPIVLSPLDSEAMPSRSTVQEVYVQVLKDLNDAISSGGLTDKKNYGYVNTWFAKGLLARVNLYKGDYPAALTYAEDVITYSPYELWTNEEYVDGWKKVPKKGRTEMLFELVNYSNDDWTDREGVAYLLHEDGYADYIVTESFLNLLNSDPNDVRNGILLAPFTAGFKKTYGNATVFVNKFPAENDDYLTDPDESAEMRLNDAPVMRLSEVYLIAAEAAAKVPNATKAAQYLNAIVLRANPDAAPVAAADATVERITIEKRKELVGEGHRFFDAMRNNETVVRYTDVNNRGFHYVLNPESQKFDRTFFRTILPIPFAEIQVNPNIKGHQNPGY